MRLTRAAQRAQHDDEPSTDATERNPLNEISPNASPEQVVAEETATKKTPARTKSKKGGKKGAKGKKAKAVEEQEEEQAQAVHEDESQSTPAPTEVMAEKEVAPEVAEDADQVLATDDRPTSPQPKEVRLTRRQLAKQEEELRQSQRAQSPSQQTKDVAQSTSNKAQEEAVAEQAVEDTDAPTNEELVKDEVDTEPLAVPEVTAKEDPEVEVQTESAGAGQVGEETDADAQELQPATAEVVEPELEGSEQGEIVGTVEAVTPSVEVTSEPEPKTLAAERPSDATSTPAMSRTPSRRASRSPSKSPMRIEESIEALDALEEALEDVGKAVSHFDQSHEEKSPRKKAFPKNAGTPKARTKTPRKTPVVTRVSKVPSAAAPKSIKPPTISLARASSVRAPPAKEVRKVSTDTVDYLASKRRPVSVSFPTPPPPPKGRAPTKATFQLSSDAVATKLKAQKEERLKREAEREAEGAPIKQRPVSMQPLAKSTKAPTKATFVLPGEAIAAKLKAQKEERQKREAEKEAESAQGEQPKARPVSFSMPPPTVKSSKPPTKATFVLPGEAIAAKLKAQREERQKREEEAEAAKKAAAAANPRGTIRKPVALPTRVQPGVSIQPPQAKNESSAPASVRSTSLASKRASMQSMRTASGSTTASKRDSIIVTKAIVTPVDAVQQKMRGREVFNRDRMEKEGKEKDKKDKEDAAKQARAQAAERGRIASREWAEKQKKKMAEAVRERAEAA